MISRGIKFTSIVMLFTAALFLMLLYFFMYPSYSNYFPKCIFFIVTGLHCPGCGSQRAFMALLHGDIFTAMHDNFLAVIFSPFLLYSLGAFYNNLFSSKKMSQKIFYSPLFVRIVLLLVVIFSILRNIPAYPFYLLAPI